MTRSYWTCERLVSAGSGMQGKHSRTNTHMDMYTDPKELQLLKHLQPLMEGLVEDPFMCECKGLAVAMFKYKDMFSSAPENMGQPNLIMHSIDTGEHRHIHLPPR